MCLREKCVVNSYNMPRKMGVWLLKCHAYRCWSWKRHRQRTRYTHGEMCLCPPLLCTRPARMYPKPCTWVDCHHRCTTWQGSSRTHDPTMMWLAISYEFPHYTLSHRYSSTYDKDDERKSFMENSEQDNRGFWLIAPSVRRAFDVRAHHSKMQQPYAPFVVLT